jgi:hypothetical protein
MELSVPETTNDTKPIYRFAFRLAVPVSYLYYSESFFVKKAY